MKKAKAILFFMVLSGLVKAATFSDSLTIQINGKAYFAENPATRLEDLMIINLRTSQGSFGKADGTFSVFVQKNDTLLIASTGYENTYYSVADSAYRTMYTADIPLKKLSRVLKEVTIFSPRDLESIYSDIKKLGYNKKDFEISGVDALNSPITFLYQEFSRVERVKRHNAERINEEKRKNFYVNSSPTTSLTISSTSTTPNLTTSLTSATSPNNT
ncbi:MAG: hypothetical protein U0X76_13300 [Bacteroidia bacterium]